jgi:CSLREA domain-containing protein
LYGRGIAVTFVNWKKVIRRWSAIAAALAGSIAMLVATGARAGTITVDSTADDTAPDHCTLREAINYSQFYQRTGTCRATTQGD